MDAPWTAEERAWAQECFLAGDALQEIGAWADRDPADVAAAIGAVRDISPRQRDILSLYSAGCTFPEIALERGGTWRACAAAVSNLRSCGLEIPYKRPRTAEANRHAA